MSLEYKILGKPGRDNALVVWINSGNKLSRILFDCGENLLNHLKQSEVKAIDYILFSHLHIDHIAGFDYFFRRNYLREEKPVLIWGPEETASIIHNRLKGYKWNLVDELPGIWYVTDIKKNSCKTFCYKTADSYREQNFVKETPFRRFILNNEDYYIQAVIMNHIIPSIGYSITEKSYYNIDKEQLKKINIKPGPWLEDVKDVSIDDEQSVLIDDKEFKIKYLRENLLYKKAGEKISYLTDFIYDDERKSDIIDLVSGSDVLVCESQYSEKDSDLAKQNYHLITKHAAEIARYANVKKLILFHISERYITGGDYRFLLDEARSVFPETYFPDGW